MSAIVAPPPTVIVKNIVDPNHTIRTELQDLSWSVSILKSFLTEELQNHPPPHDQTLVHMGRVLHDQVMLADLVRNDKNELPLHLVLPRLDFEEPDEKKYELPTSSTFTPSNLHFQPFHPMQQYYMQLISHHQSTSSFTTHPQRSNVYSRQNKPPIMLANYQPNPMSAETDYYRFYNNDESHQPAPRVTGQIPDIPAPANDANQAQPDGGNAAQNAPEQQPPRAIPRVVPQQNRVGWWSLLKLNIILRLMILFSLFGHYLGQWEWYLAIGVAAVFYLHTTGFLNYVYTRMCRRGGQNNENAGQNENGNQAAPVANANNGVAENGNAEQPANENTGPSELTFIQLLSRFVWGFVASLHPSWDVHGRLREIAN